MLARRIPAILAAFALCALLPVTASAKTKRVKAPVPADGDAALVQFDVIPKGKKALDDLKVGVKTSPGTTKELGIVVETYRSGKAVTVTAVLLNPTGGVTGRVASEHHEIAFTLKSGRTIETGDVTRIKSRLAELTDEQKKYICKKTLKGRKLVSTILGPFNDGQFGDEQIVRLIRRLICGKLTTADKAKLDELKIPYTTNDGGGGGGDQTDCNATPTAPGCGTTDPCAADPTAPGCGGTDGGGGGTTPDCNANPTTSGCPAGNGNLSCSGFDPNEVQCTFGITSGTFRVLRVQGTGGIIFSNCFGEASGPCTINNPGTPNNSIDFPFNDPRTSSGNFFSRADNQMVGDWSRFDVFTSPEPGGTFTYAGSYDAPPNP